MLYLKEWRLAKQLSQSELAVLTRIPQGALSVVERGGRNVTLGSLERIAQALNIETAALFRTPLADLRLDRQEREEIAQAIVQGTTVEDAGKDELVSDLRGIISRKLIAFKTPGAARVRTHRWQVRKRYLGLERKYGSELFKDILGRVDKLLVQYG